MEPRPKDACAGCGEAGPGPRAARNGESGRRIASASDSAAPGRSLARDGASFEPHRGARVLLVEDLDACGADVGDARARAAILKAAGTKVTWLAILPPGSTVPPADAGPIGRHLVTRDRAASTLRALARDHARWDHVLLASVAPGGGALARWLPRSARWWPTGFADGGAEDASLSRWTRHALGGSGLPSVDGTAARGAAWWLAWSVVERAGSRHAGLPLWDGDFVVAPTGLSGAAGAATLAAFADLADEWSGVDLVDWAHPTAEVERSARALAVELRVHHVGPPPRPAEWAWWSQAGAAVLTGASRLSSALVLRALAAGCPLLWVAPTGTASGLAHALEERGCLRLAGAEPRAVARALGALLERGGEVEAAVERGRELVGRHDDAAIAAQLGLHLGVGGRSPRAAA